MQQKPNKIELREINSKKGIQVYIKATNKPGRYLKYQPGAPIEAYLQYYNDKYGVHKQPQTKASLTRYIQAYAPGEETETKQQKKDRLKKIPTKLKQQVTRYLKKISKRGDINKEFKKGITDITLTNIHETTEEQITNTYKQLLKPLVLDLQLLNILCLEENIEKIKTRFEYRIKIIGENNEDLGLLKHIGQKTLRKVINELTQNLKRHMTYKEVYETIRNQIIRQGYRYEPKYRNKGHLGRIDITTIFRKG